MRQQTSFVSSENRPNKKSCGSGLVEKQSRFTTLFFNNLFIVFFLLSDQILRLKMLILLVHFAIGEAGSSRFLRCLLFIWIKNNWQHLACSFHQHIIRKLKNLSYGVNASCCNPQIPVKVTGWNMKIEKGGERKVQLKRRKHLLTASSVPFIHGFQTSESLLNCTL